MFVDMQRSLVLFCPACEKRQEHQVSLFQIKPEATAPIVCRCGFNQGHLERRGTMYQLRVFLPSGERVKLRFSASELLGSDLLYLQHPENQEDIGLFGMADAVENTAIHWEKRRPLDADEYVRPDIMAAVLSALGELADDHRISCECERPSVGIDVYADRVELVCSFCGSAVLMGASSERDVERVQRIDHVRMEPSSYTLLEEWLRPFV